MSIAKSCSNLDNWQKKLEASEMGIGVPRLALWSLIDLLDCSKKVRGKMIRAILATDMAGHAGHIKALSCEEVCPLDSISSIS